MVIEGGEKGSVREVDRRDLPQWQRPKEDRAEGVGERRGEKRIGVRKRRDQPQ